MSGEPKAIFSKTLERDSTLTMQVLFERAFTEDTQKEYGFTIPERPMFVQYVTAENIQFWENEAGVRYLLDRLFEQNQKGTEFMESVAARYKPIFERVKGYWERGSITDTKELREYFDAVRAGVLFLGTCFYTGLDERTPPGVKAIAVAMRQGDEYFARNDEFIRDCFASLGRDRSLAYLVLPDEFVSSLPTDEELQKRQSGTVLVDGEDMFVIALSDFAKNHPEYEFKDLFGAAIAVSEVKGQAAFKGVVRGLVKIVKNRAQAARVGQGEIIISPMTTPDFIDAMHRAAAFVTDEGGIICHAAIVAREMGKPCIIGTKFATQLFKDGDMVEVDANTGVVKKL